jgi:hypothetical protein
MSPDEQCVRLFNRDILGRHAFRFNIIKRLVIPIRLHTSAPYRTRSHGEGACQSRTMTTTECYEEHWFGGQ